MEQCNLDKILNETRTAVYNSGQTLHQVADGAGLTYHWVAKFAQGKINNPTVENLLMLRNYLDKIAA